MAKSQKINHSKEPSYPVSYGHLLLPPVIPNLEVTKLCRLLDDFYKTYSSQHKRQTASDLLKGAFYAARPECRSNPDWMSQAASSARDVLYPLFSPEVGKNNLIKLFSKYAIDKGSGANNKEFIETFTILDDIYKKLTDLAHHGTNLGVFSKEQFLEFSEKDFEKLLEEFVLNLKKAFSLQQIYVHTVIESLLQDKRGKNTKNEIALVLEVNPDAHQFFFFKADEHWLEWLWKNGFLDAIKEKMHDPNSYSFRMPELNYLIGVAEKKPDVVTNIICSFEISAKNFNSEVVDQFTRIASELPSRCLKKIVKKIRDEKWIKLMGKYTQYGFEYGDILETLNKAGDFESMLTLSETILLVRSKKDIKKRKISYRGDDVFYIHDLSETKVFNYLAEMPDEYLEEALSIIINAFIEAIENEGNYLLMDEDFFTLSLSGVTGHRHREELKFLAATVIELVRKIFSSKSFDNKKIFTKYFAKLPQNQITRRLKLFVLSLDPKLFIERLKVEYFKLFEVKKTSKVLYGAEYERALKAGFSYLTNTQKRDYVKNVFSLFTKFEDGDDKRWKRHCVSHILSTISENLTPEEIALAKKNGFEINPKYQPEPGIGRIRGGTVTPRSPVDLAEFSVKEIAKKLKGELTPQELQKKYKNDDFLNPRDVDGVAGQLKEGIKDRLAEYIGNATLFFDRSKLIPHYTNAFLRGVKNTLSERGSLGKLNYDELFKLLQDIKESGEKHPFDKRTDESEGRWLSGWGSVHSTMADLIEELIKQKDKKTLLNFKKYRGQVLSILEYLFNFSDPIPADEKPKTAKSTIKRPNESEYFVSDPYTIAINSVRGQAFQTLLHFVYQDASNNKKEKLADDVKVLYEKLVKKEDTRAIMFMFGHYLPSFHYRDMDWVRNKFNEIFESKSKDKYLRLAVWEGYLSNNLYKELFLEPYLQELYGKNITPKLKYPKQKFFKDPHESIAIHLALAFVYYEDFGLDNKLFMEFMNKATVEQLSAFIIFIGRSFVDGENDDVLKDEKNSWRTKRIKDFWEMILNKKKVGKSALEKFGTWIKTDKNIFDTEWLASKVCQTLAITNGVLEGDYGLIKSIEEFAKASPDNTLRILEKRLFALANDKRKYFPMHADKGWYGAFKILYENKDKKVQSETYNLINNLIEKGGNKFWDLEKIVKKKN